MTEQVTQNSHHDLMLALADDAFCRIRDILKTHHNFDIGNYKDKCMKRRIAIRLRANRVAMASQYCEILESSPREQELLLKVLTIHVSQFWRNPVMYEALRQKIIPLLLDQARGAGRQEIPIMSIGCSTGEEPYSLAIILKEYFGREMKDISVKILGVDISNAVLDAARIATYGKDRLLEAPQPLVEKYFRREGDRFALEQVIRQMVEFRPGDLSDPESYVPSDLILCRNVLIYFERKEQEEVMLRFAQALRPGGVLVLGKAETLVGQARHLFHALDPVERIYRRSEAAGVRPYLRLGGR